METKRSDTARGAPGSNKADQSAIDPLERDKDDCLAKLDVVANYIIDYTDICEHGPENVSRVVRRKKKVRVQDDSGANSVSASPAPASADGSSKSGDKKKTAKDDSKEEKKESKDRGLVATTRREREAKDAKETAKGKESKEKEASAKPKGKS